MPRKDRVVTVVDTNVFLRAILNRNPQSVNRHVLRLWVVKRRVQIVVNPFIESEYIRVLKAADIETHRIESFVEWLQLPIVTRVRSGASRVLSRDPKDNPYIDAAEVGHADFIVSNDRHLLDIPAAALRGLRFKIVKPHQLLGALNEQQR